MRTGTCVTCGKQVTLRGSSGECSNCGGHVTADASGIPGPATNRTPCIIMGIAMGLVMAGAMAALFLLAD